MTDSKQTPDLKSKPDYSDLPQKPITLKKGIGGLARPLGRQRGREEKQIPIPTPIPTPEKQPAVKKSTATTGGQWTLRGVSPEAREIAMKTAREEGVKLHEWIEQAIYHAASPAPENQISTQENQNDRVIMEAFQEIRERLERIEEQSGFVYRFWQRLKELMDLPK